MKQFILAMLTTFVISGLSYGQVNPKDLLQPSPTFPSKEVVKNFFNESSTGKKKLFCVTISCCSVGPITMEIYSQTSCHYVYTTDKSSHNLVKMELTSAKKLPEYLNVQEDIVLAGMYDSDGNSLVLPKGKYQIDAGAIYFEADSVNTNVAGKKYCWQAVHNYTVFGHEFTVEINICVKVSSGSSKSGAVTIDLSLSQDARNKLKDSNYMINLKEDILINKDGFNFKIPKGDYVVNQENQILLNNVKVK